MSRIDDYLVLQRNVDALPESEQDAVLDEMDAMWWAMSPAERDEVQRKTSSRPDP